MLCQIQAGLKFKIYANQPNFAIKILMKYVKKITVQSSEKNYEWLRSMSFTIELISLST